MIFLRAGRAAAQSESSPPPAGTSFATPIAAGIAALILSCNPNLTPQQVQDIIKQSVDDLGALGRDPFSK